MKKCWTKEKCKEEALKYEYRGEFQKNSRSAYNASIRYKILDEICSHMKIVGHLYRRCIYVYEFSDNFVYVGLTFNLDKRHKIHLKKGVVYKHLQLNKEYELKQLTEYIDINLAKEKEKEFVEIYKNNNYYILNKAKTGSLGSMKKHRNKDECKKEALKYNSRFEFQKKSSGAYNTAFLNRWLSDICVHMKSRIWTKDKCMEEALKYNSRFEYRKNSSGSYSSALRNKWLNDICDHMKPPMKRNFWNIEECKNEALKYSNRTEFATKSSYVYKLSRKNKWLDDICVHMKK